MEEYRDIIGGVLEEAQRLQLLVERLLELASAEGGAPILHRSTVQLDEYVADCVSQLSTLAEIVINASFWKACPLRPKRIPFFSSKRCRISWITPLSTARITPSFASRSRIGQLKFKSPSWTRAMGSVRRIVTASCSVSFEPSEDAIGGRRHGLGLSITKAYMRVLGGALEYEPGTLRGSVFCLRVPKSA